MIWIKTENDQFVVNLEDGKNLSTRCYKRDDREFLEKIARVMGSSALIAGAQVSKSTTQSASGSPLNFELDAHTKAKG